VGKQPDAGYHVRLHEGVGTALKEGRQGGGDVPARNGPTHEAAGPAPTSKVQLGKREPAALYSTSPCLQAQMMYLLKLLVLFYVIG
jgi:hypothetical protein